MQTKNGLFVISCSSLFLYEFGRWTLNTWLFPYFNGVMPIARELLTAVSAVVCLISVVLIARVSYASAFLDFAHKASLPAIAIGLGTIYLALGTSSPELLAVGAIVYGVGVPWVFIAASVTLLELGSTEALLAVVAAVIMKCLVVIIAAPFTLSLAAAVIAQGILVFGSRLLSWSAGSQIPKSIGKGQSSGSLALMHPKSFVSSFHPFFISVLISGILCGFALTYQSYESMPRQTVGSVVPLTMVLLVVLFFKDRKPFDVLYLGSVILVMSGMAFFFPTYYLDLGGELAALSNLLFAAGSDCLLSLSLLLVAAVGRRNSSDSFRVSALFEIMITLGILGGATAGHVFNGSSEHASWAFSLAMALFATYNFIILGKFSFDDIVSEVKPVSVTLPHFFESLDERCAIIATTYVLTPRESEIFCFLARGRSVSVVQETLVLSYNTVKTHVKNIYRKTGVHSQQELIDLVDRWEG